MKRAHSPWGGGDFTTSLAFVFPLLLAYEIGVVFADTLNGVDFLTVLLSHLVKGDRTTYLLVHAGLALAYLIAVLILRRVRGIDFGAFLPMLLESAIYALTLGSLIVFVMEHVFGFLRPLAVDSGVLLGITDVGNVIVVSLGAGVHEELVFRLGLFGGSSALFSGLGMRKGLAVGLALLISSVLFSAAHHVGALGEPFELGVFVYRLLAGVIFAMIFYFRSFAHAVYTHFLYDLYVLLLRS